ncbi:MAG: hypothetical protein Q7T55_05495, partial [Solirubrobacteraceae bacterium]|nr:hypothetical protein [Solirubrobacteraceae bacterium]
LSARGGIDDGSGQYGFSLKNAADESVSIRDIALEVVRVDPTPTAATAYVFTQGDRALGKFLARLDGPLEVGQRVPLYQVVGGQAPSVDAAPHFRDNYISLEPGEGYEGKISVTNAIEPPPGLVEFRFVIEVFSSSGRFTVRDENFFKYTDTESVPAEHQYSAGYVTWLRSQPAPYGCPQMRAREWFEVLDDRQQGCPKA